MPKTTQQPVQASPVKPAAAKPPLPSIPAEFDATTILKLDAPKLIEMLRDPAATVFQKAKACHRLAVLGGKDAVPALASLLSHPELSNYARFGLEPNPDPSADAALRAAVPRLKGRLLAGVATSLGVRRDAKSADLLAKLLADSDLDVAGAAAAALGRIGGPAAGKILQQALTAVRTEFRPVVARASLICADGLMAANRAQAMEMYQTLSESPRPRAVRLAAISAMSGTRNKTA
jgi:HEAT repeat protein